MVNLYKIKKAYLFISIVLIMMGNCYSQNIAFALHTVHEGTLKMNAQLTVQSGNYPTTATLEINDGSWKQVASTNIVVDSWTALFKVENWDQTKDTPYRVVYNGSNWAGVVRKDPVAKDTIVVAAFTGNARARNGGDLSKADIVANMTVHGADLLVFTGDQVYPHNNHLTYWLEFGASFGELFRDLPVVSLPDDHDAGQGNLFGEGGIAGSGVNGYNNGGYVKSATYVKRVERQQTSHLPDPFDPTPVAQGIGVYYTDLTVGGINFAIIEDRKFKTGPQGIVPDAMWSASGRPDHIKLNTPGYTPTVVDVPQAILLGDRQLQFLDTWAKDWSGGVEMKSVLSATIFANMATHHSGDGELTADLDSNGWPQTGRNKALKNIRKAFANMIAGDQHLASLVQHGVDAFGDAGYSFVVPSIANFYPRSWFPDSVGNNRQPGMPTYIGSVVPNVGTVNHAITGDYHDGFGNKVSVWAVGNPENLGKTPTNLHNWSPGYGIIKFSKNDRTVTMENWPRQANPRTDNQYEGWPVTVSQMDNYGRAAVQYIPTLDIRGMQDPVVQVINERTGEVEYTLRINGTTFRPKVFETGLYTIKVGELGTANEETLTGIQSIPANQSQTLVVTPVPIKKKIKSILGKEDAKISWRKSIQKISIKVSGNVPYLVDVIEPNGKIVYTRILQGVGEYFITIPNLKSAVYLINAKSKNRRITKKIRT